MEMTRKSMKNPGLILLLFCLLAPTELLANNQRIALVIGNAAYNESPLVNPRRDADAVANRLRMLDFEVVKILDGDLGNMQQGLLSFMEKIKTGATAVVYYAGHGIQANGRNYLLPVDISLSSENALRFQALEMTDVLEELERSGASTNIVILDACRNNPFERKFRGGSRGLAVVDAAVGTLIAYATAPGQVASDGEGIQGLYTGALLKALEVPGLKVEEVFKQVRIEVADQSGRQQIPWESSSLTGDFVFNPAVNNQASTSAASYQTASTHPVDQNRQTATQSIVQEQETLLWQSIENSNNIADFQSYLNKYPAGTYSAIAIRRTQSIESLADKDGVCRDLSGQWLNSSPNVSCNDIMTLSKVSDGKYSFHYQVCSAIGAVSNIQGQASLEGNVLTSNWSSFPCGGITEYTFDKGCLGGEQKIIKSKGIPGICNVFVKKGAQSRFYRAPDEL